MKKRLYLLSLLCLSAGQSGLSAQNNKIKISADLGYTYSLRHANLSNYINAKYVPGYGIGTNLAGEYTFGHALFVSSGISILQKNYKYEKFGNLGDEAKWYTRYTNTYLHVPFSIGGYLIHNPYRERGIWIKLSGGIYVEHWLNMKRTGQYPALTQPAITGKFAFNKVSEQYDFNKNENRLKRFGNGLQGGAQLGYALTKFDIYANYNLQYGLSDINETSDTKSKKITTRAYIISLGISYKL